MYDKNTRIGWDKALKEYSVEKVLDSPISLICHLWFKSPLILVSERDFYEKRVEFLEDDYCVSIGFAANDSQKEEIKKVVRCLNYINIQEIIDLGEYWEFVSYGQSDLKMPIPESFLNFTLPMKFNDWYESYVKFINKDYKEIEKQIEKEAKEKNKKK